jgi:predicted alpha/beta-hydrolase family hydrolase
MWNRTSLSLSRSGGLGWSARRYEFPYLEQESKRPDAPKLAQATVRAAVIEGSHLVRTGHLPRIVDGSGHCLWSD